MAFKVGDIVTFKRATSVRYRIAQVDRLGNGALLNQQNIYRLSHEFDPKGEEHPAWPWYSEEAMELVPPLKRFVAYVEAKDAVTAQAMFQRGDIKVEEAK